MNYVFCNTEVEHFGINKFTSSIGKNYLWRRSPDALPFRQSRDCFRPCGHCAFTNVKHRPLSERVAQVQYCVHESVILDEKRVHCATLIAMRKPTLVAIEFVAFLRLSSAAASIDNSFDHISWQIQIFIPLHHLVCLHTISL